MLRNFLGALIIGAAAFSPPSRAYFEVESLKSLHCEAPDGAMLDFDAKTGKISWVHETEIITRFDYVKVESWSMTGWFPGGVYLEKPGSSDFYFLMFSAPEIQTNKTIIEASTLGYAKRSKPDDFIELGKFDCEILVVKKRN